MYLLLTRSALNHCLCPAIAALGLHHSMIPDRAFFFAFVSVRFVKFVDFVISELSTSHLQIIGCSKNCELLQVLRRAMLRQVR